MENNGFYAAKALSGDEIFIDFVQNESNSKLGSGGSYGTYLNQMQFLRKFTDFLFETVGAADLRIRDVNAGVVRDFDSWLRRQRSSHGRQDPLSPNTIGTLLGTMKSFLNRGRGGVGGPLPNPFEDFRIRTVATAKERLDMAEIRSLMRLNLSGKRESIAWTRDAFLFSFFCHGMRVSDLLTLRWSDCASGGILTYKMRKNHKVKTLVLEPYAVGILVRCMERSAGRLSHVFPFLDGEPVCAAQAGDMSVEERRVHAMVIRKWEAVLNRRLKVVARLAGISKNLTFHVARHSFAAMAMKCGVHQGIIQRALAHSRLSTTEGYTGQFADEEVSAALHDVYRRVAPSAPGRGKVERLVSQLRRLSREELAAVLSGVLG